MVPKPSRLCLKRKKCAQTINLREGEEEGKLSSLRPEKGGLDGGGRRRIWPGQGRDSDLGLSKEPAALLFKLLVGLIGP